MIKSHKIKKVSDESEITRMYGTFIEYLEIQCEKLALLQITGKIEDYLVKEFTYHIHTQSEGKQLGILNFGGKGQRKYDLLLAKGQLDGDKKDKLEINCIVEAKYFRNQHRFFTGPYGKKTSDEIGTGLNSLKEQIKKPFKGKRHGEIPVSLSSPQKPVYGLVFVSLLSTGEEKYEKNFLGKASEKGFRYHNENIPKLDTVHENTRVDVLDTYSLATLKMGLWVSR